MTTVNNSISSSCQSIISTSLSAGGGLGGSGSNMRSGHYINGTGSLGRLKYHKSLDASDEELDYSQLSQSTHILGRVRSERFLSSKSDENRRRRTIIVEKKNDSYGFTLQSYGIHYKKDEEIEMITYVDYVEYDGPAYKAGMREGDVILSINGTDMEKADHKTLVEFIKSCDTRMRMVVQFEDCVRKVDLHMRYIQLQGMLQSKMNELERICLRERELLEGRWKTHSLPARKKVTTSPTDADVGVAQTTGEMPYYRPTLSTEDVGNASRNHYSMQTIIPPPAQFMLSYHYLDPNHRYILKPTSSNSSGDYFVSVADGVKRSPSDQHFILTRTGSADAANVSSMQAQVVGQHRKTAGTPPVPPPRTCEKHKPPNKQQQPQPQPQQQSVRSEAMQTKTQKSTKHSCHGHSCNPCIGHFRWKSAEKAAASAAAAANNGDNVSLDAYDLASPCCDAHCVPTRRRARHHKEHTHKHKHRDRDRDRNETGKDRAASVPGKAETGTSPGTAVRHIGHHHHHHHTISGVDPMQQQHQHQHQHYQHQHQHQHHGSGTTQTGTTQHYYVHQQQQQQPQSQSQSQSQQQQQQQQHLPRKCDSRNGSIGSRYFDLTAGMASHCSLHSCTSSEFAAADTASYATSLSTDTLYWDPKSENPSTSRQHSTKSRQSYQHQQQQQQQQPQQIHMQQQQQQPQQQQQQQPQQQQPQQVHGVYQQRYHITATQIQPSQIYPNATAYVQKPKSWDNLTTKAIGGYGFGYGYLDTLTVKPAVKLQIAQQRHSIPRKNPYGRYSTYTDVENYAPPPSQFVEELTTTTTTTITAKSTEELIACDCLSKQQQQQQQQALKAAQLQIGQGRQLSHQNSCQMGGYYSHLPRPTTDAATSTVSEITRL